MTTALKAFCCASILLATHAATHCAVASTPPHEASAESDLAVSLSRSLSTVDPGSTSLVWTIDVSNAGPSATLAQVFDALPDGASAATWVCSAPFNAICSANGAGDISDVVYLNSGDTVTYQVTAHVPAAIGWLHNNVLVGALNGIVDPDTTNNIAGDDVLVSYTEAPVVLGLDSASSPGTCGLQDGMETQAGITQIMVRFSHQMLPADITNTNNYRVIEAGADGVFQSTGCANAPSGDDRAIEPTAVDYDQALMLASLHVDIGLKSLPSGKYRIMACAGLHDISNLALAGDGGPGTDFHSDFSILGTNLLANPNFDHPPDIGWNAEIDPVFGDPLDVAGAPFSGSAAAFGTDSANRIEFTQCVDGITAGIYRIGLRTEGFVGHAPPGGFFAYVTAEQGCPNTTWLAFFGSYPIAIPGDWERGDSGSVRVYGPWVPPQSGSVWARIFLVNVPLGITARMDSAFLRREDDDVVFRNGVDFSTSCPSH